MSFIGYLMSENGSVDEASAKAKLAYLKRRLQRLYFRKKPTAQVFKDIQAIQDDSLTESISEKILREFGGARIGRHLGISEGKAQGKEKDTKMPKVHTDNRAEMILRRFKKMCVPARPLLNASAIAEG